MGRPAQMPRMKTITATSMLCRKMLGAARKGWGTPMPGLPWAICGEERIRHQQSAQVGPEVVGQPAGERAGQQERQRGQEVAGVGPEDPRRAGREVAERVLEPGRRAPVEQHVGASAERVQVLGDRLIGEVAPGDREVAGGPPVEDREALDVRGPQAAQPAPGQGRGARLELGPAGLAAGGEGLQVHGTRGAVRRSRWGEGYAPRRGLRAGAGRRAAGRAAPGTAREATSAPGRRRAGSIRSSSAAGPASPPAPPAGRAGRPGPAEEGPDRAQLALPQVRQTVDGRARIAAPQVDGGRRRRRQQGHRGPLPHHHGAGEKVAEASGLGVEEHQDRSHREQHVHDEGGAAQEVGAGLAVPPSTPITRRPMAALPGVLPALTACATVK